jgi:hypothetical protein
VVVQLELCYTLPQPAAFVPQVRQYEFDPVSDPEGAWQVASHAEDLTCHLYRLHGILSARSHFGVVACARRRPWLATVVAVEGTELYSLSRERLHVSGETKGPGLC